MTATAKIREALEYFDERYSDGVARKALTALDALEKEREWQPIETAPRDGTPFYVHLKTPMRWLPYKRASHQFKAGVQGRWQMMNDYGGWDNTNYEPVEWQPHAATIAGIKQEGGE